METDTDFDMLADQLADIEDKIDALKEASYIVQSEIIQAMEDMGSFRMPTATGTLKLNVKYHPSILARLREITPPDQLVGAYFPEHEETKVEFKPERWNMVVGKKLRDLSTEHADIIDQAKVVVGLKLERKKVKS
jgi:hypothetical protein